MLRSTERQHLLNYLSITYFDHIQIVVYWLGNRWQPVARTIAAAAIDLGKPAEQVTRQ